MAAPHTHINELLNKFNAFHPRLKFTMEIGGTSLNFSEISILIRNRQLMFDWYHKPTFSRRLLNYHSKHSMMHKRGVITSFIDKILLLSHSEYQQKNFFFLINIFLNINYPLNMIFSSIRKRLSVKFKQFNNQGEQSSTNEIRDNFFVIPYINHTAEKFIQYFKKIPNFKLAFYGIF